jgi:hypothetical protein
LPKPKFSLILHHVKKEISSISTNSPHFIQFQSITMTEVEKNGSANGSAEGDVKTEAAAAAVAVAVVMTDEIKKEIIRQVSSGDPFNWCRLSDQICGLKDCNAT